MATSNQGDLFGGPAQPDLFGSASPPAYKPDLGKVRARIEAILAEARAAEAMSGDWDEHSLYQAAFPSLIRHLSDEEAAQYRLAFEAELARLDAAAD